MKVEGLITGQRINSTKLQQAKKFRKEMTEAEKVLWFYLRDRKLKGLRFRRQQIITGFIADFYCDSLGLVIELDGEVHDNRQPYDLERDRILESRGLQVLRFSNEAVLNNTNQVLQSILDFENQSPRFRRFTPRR